VFVIFLQDTYFKPVHISTRTVAIRNKPGSVLWKLF
jgi:uncharacterized protein (UPF0248 family)